MGVSVGHVVDAGQHESCCHGRSCSGSTHGASWVIEHLEERQDAYDGNDAHEEQAPFVVGVMCAFVWIVRTMAHRNLILNHNLLIF